MKFPHLTYSEFIPRIRGLSEKPYNWDGMTMSDSLIERASKAILDEGRNFGALAHHLKGADALERRLAVAVLKAIREPTPAMVDAAREHHEGQPYLPYSLFRSMIDAALAEQP